MLSLLSVFFRRFKFLCRKTPKYEFTYATVDILKGCFYVKWGCKNFGFGEFTIRTKPDGTLTFDTECTSEEFILDLMSYIMKQSEIR